MQKVLLLAFVLCSSVHAQVVLRDVGVIGLASHDIFTWDKKTETNTEDGRINLSTIFDYDNGSRWEKGGNPKNAENAPVYTITSQLVYTYKQELKKHGDKILAREVAVEQFLGMIKESFTRMSGLTFPTVCVDEAVTNTEQAVLRAMHDILPGKINLLRRPLPRTEINLTNFLTAKIYLNQMELDQPIKGYDGDYDVEYKNIQIPFTTKKVNLMEVDKAFIEKFSPYKQADMLSELAKVGAGDLKIHNVSFIHHFEELFSKAICK